MSLRQYKVKLLREEFPFIDRLFVNSEGNTDFWPENVDDIKIKKGDKNLLNYKGNVSSYSWGGGDTYDYTKYFAVYTEKDEQLAIELENEGNFSNGGGDHNEWNADTIGEQLFLQNIVPDYIVQCVRNDTDANGNGQITHFWIIYKMQKFDLKAHHQLQIQKAADILKAEIAAVCS